MPFELTFGNTRGLRQHIREGHRLLFSDIDDPWVSSTDGFLGKDLPQWAVEKLLISE